MSVKSNERLDICIHDAHESEESKYANTHRQLVMTSAQLYPQNLLEASPAKSYPGNPSSGSSEWRVVQGVLEKHLNK